MSQVRSYVDSASSSAAASAARPDEASRSRRRRSRSRGELRPNTSSTAAGGPNSVSSRAFSPGGDDHGCSTTRSVNCQPLTTVPDGGVSGGRLSYGSIASARPPGRSHTGGGAGNAVV